MRLIDADALIKRIADIKWKFTDDANAIEIIGMEYANSMNDMVQDLIRRTPTAYDIDKVVEEMENEIKLYENSQSIMGCNDADIEYYGAMKGLGKAIEIVKQHKYNF